MADSTRYIETGYTSSEWNIVGLGPIRL